MTSLKSRRMFLFTRDESTLFDELQRNADKDAAI